VSILGKYYEEFLFVNRELTGFGCFVI